MIPVGISRMYVCDLPDHPHNHSYLRNSGKRVTIIRSTQTLSGLHLVRTEEGEEFPAFEHELRMTLNPEVYFEVWVNRTRSSLKGWTQLEPKTKILSRSEAKKLMVQTLRETAAKGILQIAVEKYDGKTDEFLEAIDEWWG